MYVTSSIQFSSFRPQSNRSSSGESTIEVRRKKSTALQSFNYDNFYNEASRELIKCDVMVFS